jgi:hypothetical protein
LEDKLADEETTFVYALFHPSLDNPDEKKYYKLSTTPYFLDDIESIISVSVFVLVNANVQKSEVVPFRRSVW